MRLRRNGYDAVFLDLDLPGMDGVETCSLIRTEFPSVWIIAVASQDNIEDRVDALNAGADHYLNKPLQMREFAAQTRAVMRRLQTSASTPRGTLVVGKFHLDLAKQVVKQEGHEIRLTMTGFNLLYQLMASAGRPIPHSVLLDIVWGNHTEKERGYLRIYISQLRKKLEIEPTQSRFLQTYMNVGYIFASP